ncbi:MAG TPA: hypothetical protein VM532_12420 [Burkholderiales bacterium]|nr:hypothetical protein [Burkholderiales bacterium]
MLTNRPVIRKNLFDGVREDIDRNLEKIDRDLTEIAPDFSTPIPVIFWRDIPQRSLAHSPERQSQVTLPCARLKATPRKLPN